MHEAEAEAYKLIKERKKRPEVDDGLNKTRRAEERQERAVKKSLRQSASGALNGSNMHYHNDEKLIQQYYRNRFTIKVKEEKGEVSIVDEMIIDLLSYAAVRVFRKSRLESMFGRFMDRTAPQDPVAQILSCIKSLGLRNNLKGTETGKEAISKLLGSDAEEMASSGSVLTFEEWQQAEKAKGTRIQRRADTDFAINDSFYKTPQELDDDEEQEESDNFDTISSSTPKFEV